MRGSAFANNPNDLDGRAVQRAYRFWAPVYDVAWRPVLSQAHKAAALAARDVGGRILEIGVGTGLTFDHYRGAEVEIYGIDRCEEMLAKARQKVESGRYPEVRDLQNMDAHDLRFPDGFFDCVLAQFVITLVAKPEVVLSECARVLRPGGELILASHFYSERGIIAGVERLSAAPLRALGLRPEFPFGRLVRWAESDGRAELVESRKIGFTGHTLVRFRRLAVGDAAEQPAPAAYADGAPALGVAPQLGKEPQQP